VLAAADYLLPVDLRILIGLYPVGLLVEFFAHMRKYNKWCEDNFSSMDDIDAQWITRYIIMLVVVEALQFWNCLSDEPTRFFTQELFFIFMVAYTTERVLFRPDPWKLMRSTAPEEAAAEEEPSEQPFAAYRATLEEWMEQEKPYVNPDFQLMDLREVLPLNRTYLSQLINTEYGCSFFHWVNGYRTNEAKRLLRESPDLPMQDVSKQCGFSSPTVFARVFARETGLLPREWVNQIDNA
jgi:AraC-like DNA-binding protein